MYEDSCIQTHPYTRKWGFESLISPKLTYTWNSQTQEITKLLQAVAEKFIRDKKMYQPHIDTFNLFLTEYLSDILETSQDTAIFTPNNEEHTIFVDNIRLLPPTEINSKTSKVIRILPDACNTRRIHYNFNIVVDIIYKIYKYKMDFPTENPPKTPEEILKYQKHWLKMRDLRKKQIGRKKYYAEYAPGDSRIGAVLKDMCLGPIPIITGTFLCHLQSSLLQAGEGIWDPLGLFCVSGTYRTISPLKDLLINQDFVDADNKYTTLEVWSSHESKLHHSTHTLFMYYDKKLDKSGRCKRTLSLQLPFSRCTLDIVTIFWSLGWTPSDMLVSVRMAARKQWKNLYYEILNTIIQNARCTSQEEAFLEISEVEQKNLTDPKVYLIESAKCKISQQLLPRIGQSFLDNNAKAKYLGYLIWRLLMHGEQVESLDLNRKEIYVTLKDKNYEIQNWMRIRKNGELRIKKKHRDHLGNTTSQFPGQLMGSLFRQVFGIHWKQVRSHLQATLAAGKPVMLPKLFKHNEKLAARIQYCVSTGRWSSAKDKDCRQNVSQAFSMNSHIAQESHYTYHSTAMNSDGKNTAPRQINETQLFYLCPGETPETKKCGLTGHFTQVADFCLGSPANDCERTFYFYQEELHFIPDYQWIEIYNDNGFLTLDLLTIITINGKPLGYTPHPELFIRFFLILRRTLTIDPYISISYDKCFDIIQIRTDRGRITAPFLIFSRLHLLRNKLPTSYTDSNIPANYIAAYSTASKDAPAFMGPRAQFGLFKKLNPTQTSEKKGDQEKEEIKKEKEIMNAVLPWTILHSLGVFVLLGEGLIDFIDPLEKKMTVILMNEKDYFQRLKRGFWMFTHIALDPHFMFSVTSGQTPYIPHIQSPRLTYQANMTKADVHCPFNLYQKSKTKHELFYVHQAFVNTVSATYRNGYLSNSNIEVISGLSVYFGYSVEDAQNIGRNFTQRGGGLMATTKLFYIEKRKKKSNSNREAFGKPKTEDCVGLKYANYNTITEDGIPLIDTKIKQGDVIIGQTGHFRYPLMHGLTHANKAIVLKKKRRCLSKVYHHDEDAIVSNATLGTNLDGTQFCNVELRSLRYFRIGDKGTSRSAQKGTQSIVFLGEDAPELADGSGIIFEYLCNPQAFPKRMTIGMLIEMAFSHGVAKGYLRFSDATAFRRQIKNLEDLRKITAQYGFSFRGTQVRDGKTGREIECLIFYGLHGYSKLKHCAIDKQHVRAKGPENQLTRQAVEGRAKGGGLRFGEMERQCLSALNTALLLRQQMYHLADAYEIAVCMNCGIFAIQHKRAPFPYCKACNQSDIVFVPTCYAFKLLTQELMGMLIWLKINVKPIEDPKKDLYKSINADTFFQTENTECMIK